MYKLDTEKFDIMVDGLLANDKKYCEYMKELINNISISDTRDIKSLFYPMEARIAEIFFEKGFQYGMSFIISNIKNVNIEEIEVKGNL